MCGCVQRNPPPHPPSSIFVALTVLDFALCEHYVPLLCVQLCSAFIHLIVFSQTTLHPLKVVDRVFIVFHVLCCVCTWPVEINNCYIDTFCLLSLEGACGCVGVTAHIRHAFTLCVCVCVCTCVCQWVCGMWPHLHRRLFTQVFVCASEHVGCDLMYMPCWFIIHVPVCVGCDLMYMPCWFIIHVPVCVHNSRCWAIS